MELFILKTDKHVMINRKMEFPILWKVWRDVLQNCYEVQITNNYGYSFIGDRRWWKVEQLNEIARVLEEQPVGQEAANVLFTECTYDQAVHIISHVSFILTEHRVNDEEFARDFMEMHTRYLIPTKRGRYFSYKRYGMKHGAFKRIIKVREGTYMMILNEKGVI